MERGEGGDAGAQWGLLGRMQARRCSLWLLLWLRRLGLLGLLGEAECALALERACDL